MPNLPALDISKRVNHSPHVVILGAGASRATAPHGDAAGRRLPVMDDLVEIVGLGDILAEASIPTCGRNFEEIYSELCEGDAHDLLKDYLEKMVRDYFAGLELPVGLTSYDILLLSLREKDVIATFNWDPFLLQAYRRNARVRKLPQLLFLHGCVSLGVCNECRIQDCVGRKCGKCGRPLTPTRLLYPVKEKDYTADPFISSQWAALREAVNRAYFLTIFGYSAPISDAAAIELLHSMWRDNGARTLAEVEIIDIQSKEVVYPKWERFITRSHYLVRDDIRRSYLAWHPRRSCEALAFATLQNDPWADDWLPDLDKVDALQEWLEPLLQEEDALKRDGSPLSGQPCTNTPRRLTT